MSTAHRCEDLIQLFDQCFLQSHETRLVRGGDEPVYLPKSALRKYHEIHFAHGFFSSGLHEIAHWLIAGEKRRQQEDFGYWYCPDGRNLEQQALFEQVEVKPQAIEWILAQAARWPFRVSTDNLNGCESDPWPFKRAVHRQVQAYIAGGLSERTQSMRLALCRFYGNSEPLTAAAFSLDDL